MTPRQSSTDTLLTSEETTFIRQALCACTEMLAWIRHNGGPQGAALLAGAAVACGRTARHAEYDANLAVDYLDFPRNGGQAR